MAVLGRPRMQNIPEPEPEPVPCERDPRWWRLCRAECHACQQSPPGISDATCLTSLKPSIMQAYVFPPLQSLQLAWSSTCRPTQPVQPALIEQRRPAMAPPPQSQPPNNSKSDSRTHHHALLHVVSGSQERSFMNLQYVCIHVPLHFHHHSQVNDEHFHHSHTIQGCIIGT
jgi:hypothetical protein